MNKDIKEVDTYNSDKPILSNGEDAFNRKEFAKRIADTIKQQNRSEGLVIGLYGAWGEGKTSVLNMFENEFNKDEFIVIKFNPWRCNDIDSMLLEFYNQISKELNKSLNNWLGKVTSKITDYAPNGIGFFNIDIDFSNTINRLKEIDLESSKEKINKFLLESKRKVVIIIDDIDRLDKNEIYTLFKVVKLSLDFKNTYFLLSFDDKMVATSLGEKYGNEGEKAGYDYLEKIVQVPLRIPKVYEADLYIFLFEQILNLLRSYDVLEHEDENIEILNDVIRFNIMPKVKTPRSAIQFINVLSFSIPLVKGEVNLNDFVIFEGLKLFYPEQYDFINKNRGLFTETSQSSFEYEVIIQDNIVEYERFISLEQENMTKSEMSALKRILEYLFPFLVKGEINNTEEWRMNKRICSKEYFSKYFIYGVPSDDFSDTEFDKRINRLKENPSECKTIVRDLIQDAKTNIFIRKVKSYENDLDFDTRKALINGICINLDLFSNQESDSVFDFITRSEKDLIAFILVGLIKKVTTQSKNELIEIVMSNKNDFKFTTHLRSLLDSKTNEILKKEEVQLVNDTFIETFKSIYTNPGKTIFDCYDFQESTLYDIYEVWFDTSSADLHQYIENTLNSKNELVENFIYSFVGSVKRTSDKHETVIFKTDFTISHFEYINKIYNVENVLPIILKVYPEIEQWEVKTFGDRNEGQTSKNALAQFVQIYNSKKINSITV